MLSIIDYELRKINLVRASCPVELMASVANQALHMPVVVEKNRKNYGYVDAIEYCPPAVVVAGAARRKRLLAAGLVSSWAFVEKNAGVPYVKTGEVLSNIQLLNKLQETIAARYFDGSLQASWPAIIEAFPFENQFNFCAKNRKYAQRYTLDPVESRVRLEGAAILINACTQSMPLVQTGLQYLVAPPEGNSQTSTRGARNSELVTSLVRNMSNIGAAVAAYLDAVKNGLHKPMKPSFAPVQLSEAGKLVSALAAHGIAPVDFVNWWTFRKAIKTRRAS